jgi:hypothetical protein
VPIAVLSLGTEFVMNPTYSQLRDIQCLDGCVEDLSDPLLLKAWSRVRLDDGAIW